MTEYAGREALRALAWVVTKEFLRKKTRAARKATKHGRGRSRGGNPTLAAIVDEARAVSFVYVVSSDTGVVKVGFSKDVASRLATLQTGNPDRLKVYTHHEVPASLAQIVERRAHELLHAAHMCGEWFQVTAHEAEDAILTAILEIVPREPAPA